MKCSKALMASAAGLAVHGAWGQVPNRFDLLESNVPKIQAALQSRLMSSEDLVTMYLTRIV